MTKMKISRYHRLSLLGVLLAALTACALPLSGADPTPPARQATVVLNHGAGAPAGATATPEAVLIPMNPAFPLEPMFPVTEPVPTSTPPPPVQAGEAQIITRRITEARLGPGFNYEVSHTLGAGSSAIVRGRSADGQWWGIPGPGDGPGPVTWVLAADVDFTGDAGSVPVLSAPSAGRTDVPIHSDPGSPPSNACIATPLGSGLGPVFIRLGPGEQFNVSYRLGGWAEVLKTELNWHLLFLGPGETGWVNGNEVELSGTCS